MCLIFFPLSPKWRNSSLNICQANCCSKCSYFSPSPWFADYLIRTSLCFLLHWFLLRIQRVAPNLEKTWNFREPTDSVSFSLSMWKWAEGHIPCISKTLLNTILFTRWVDCLSASSTGHVRPAIYVKHLPYWSPAVSTWNELAKKFFKFQPMNTWIHKMHKKPSSTGDHFHIKKRIRSVCRNDEEIYLVWPFIMNFFFFFGNLPHLKCSLLDLLEVVCVILSIKLSKNNLHGEC